MLETLPSFHASVFALFRIARSRQSAVIMPSPARLNLGKMM